MSLAWIKNWGRRVRSNVHTQFGLNADGLNKDDYSTVKAEFDAEFYLSQNPDVLASGLDPLSHFLVFGWQEARDPSADFSVDLYLSQNPDVREGGINPFVHWVLHGRAEGRPAVHPSKYDSAEQFATEALGLSKENFESVLQAFDPEYYRSEYPDIVLQNADPLLHFLVFGWAENRSPSRGFHISEYVAANPDLSGLAYNPFLHWVLHGQAEGRSLRLDKFASSAKLQIELDSVDWDAAVPQGDIDDISDLFDAEYYLAAYPDVAELSGVDPKAHYLLVGWRMGYNPRADFSTQFYIGRYPDIKRSDRNPFLHYCRYGINERRETQSYVEVQRDDYRPKVSVVIPNYNHARFLPERIASVANQTYQNFELIILDDKSTDNSCDVIKETIEELGIDARLIFNTTNSGNIFLQWQRGIELATGDLIWICESDDFCEPDFLERLVPNFVDQSVNIAFGRIQLSKGDGTFKEGLDGYRENAEPGIWQHKLKRPAAEWFDGALGVNNVIANVGGCIFRNLKLPTPVWAAAQEYRICGDWFLYLHLAGPGQIVFEPRAVSYFRQHAENSSASNFDQLYYYEEHFRVLEAIVHAWGISRRTRERFLKQVSAQFDRMEMAQKVGPFESYFKPGWLLDAPRKSVHVQMHFLGFRLGGGEIFPINLANTLLRAGVQVSMLATEFTDVNDGVRELLDPRIPVYSGIDIAARGRGTFLNAAGVSLIHSHIAASDALLVELDDAPIERPYVVTLHGSYDGEECASPKVIAWVSENVDHWIYLTDRNLAFLRGQETGDAVFEKLANAMPKDPKEPDFTRQSLGIGVKDQVFALVGRAVSRKGWLVAVDVFRDLKVGPNGEPIHLWMVGDGEISAQARERASGCEHIKFFGYQQAVSGILRMSDCLVMPTRFEGESFPLTLIQALQVGLPSIATDVGDIASMLVDGDKAAGLLLEFSEDEDAFRASLRSAVQDMCNPETRRVLGETAHVFAKRYDLEALGDTYLDIYKQASERFDAK